MHTTQGFFIKWGLACSEACVRIWSQVAQATSLCRPATRRTESTECPRPIPARLSSLGSRLSFRSAGRRPGRASRPRYPFFGQALSLSPLLLGLMASPPVQAAELGGTSAVKVSQTAANQIRLRGRVVCINEEKNRQKGGVELPAQHEHVWGFKTADGKLYSLLRTKFSEAICLDEQVRSKELVLKGRVLPDNNTFDVAIIHSIRNGLEHDLYYYCDVCSIQFVAPEICVCCQGPVRLVEKPVTDKSETVPEE